MAIKETIKGEPIALVGLLQAIALIVTVFVADLTQEQTAAILGLAIALGTYFGRSKVSPV